MESTIAQSLAIAPRMLRGLLVGFFAGAASGTLTGALLFTGLVMLVDPTIRSGFSAMFAGGMLGFPSATAIGSLFGLLDGFLDGRLANSLNRKREWVFIGAPVGVVGGAIFLGLLSYEPYGMGSELISISIGLGALLGLPAGAIASPIFGFIYKRLTPSSAVTKPATTNRGEP